MPAETAMTTSEDFFLTQTPTRTPKETDSDEGVEP